MDGLTENIYFGGCVNVLNRDPVFLEDPVLPEVEATRQTRKRQRNFSPRVIRKVLPEIDAEMVIKHRAQLNQLGELEIVARQEYHLIERTQEVTISPLRVYLMNTPTVNQERAMMPCANMNFLIDNFDHKHGYTEIIRDRFKDWRNILWTEIAPNLKPFKNQVGKKLHERVPDRKLFLDGVLMNRLLILRRGVLFGKLPMVVSVYGMGIAGRVYLKTHKIPRHIRIEAYCPRKFKTYCLRVELSDLETLFNNRIHLLEAGHKILLCETLLSMIWHEEKDDELKIGIVQDKCQRRQRRLEVAMQRQQMLDDITELANTVTDSAAEQKVPKAFGRPWLRLVGIIYSAGLHLTGYYVVLTMHVQPKRKSTFIVRAYDSLSSKFFELYVSGREMAKILADEKEVDLWDQEHRKENCRNLVQYLELKLVARGEMALFLGSRHGIPAPQIFKHHAVIVSEQNLKVPHLKKPRRDIGQGRLLFRRHLKIAYNDCLVTCYVEDEDAIKLMIYRCSTSTTHCLKFSHSLIRIFSKQNPSLLEDFLAGSDKKTAVDLVQFLLCHRVTITANQLKLNHEIYRRGHKLRNLATEDPRFVYGVVFVSQGDGWLKFELHFECNHLALDISSEEMMAIISDLESFDILERQVHLGAIASTFAVARVEEKLQLITTTPEY